MTQQGNPIQVSRLWCLYNHAIVQANRLPSARRTL